MDQPFSKRNPVFEGVEFGIGCWAWGDRMVWGYGRGYSEDDLRAAFAHALELGITFFDTAEVYGLGLSEKLLGKFIRESGVSVKVATKFMPFPWRLSRSSLMRALRNSLKRLGLSRVDLYQIHFPLPPLTVETWMTAMLDAHQAGLTAAIGVSNFNRQQTQRAYEMLARHGVTLASNQVEYHLLNREIEKNGLLKLCQELGVTVIAYSPLAMGLLTGKYTAENPPHGTRGGRYSRKYLERIQPLILQLRRIGANHDDKTPAQVALNWVLCKGALPIPGAKTFEQVEQNAGALGWRLSDEEVQILDEISEQVSRES
ncbi:MAG: aldo/keto reductase [Anaerolineales bacterium]|jgi:aryl-alcohol dehydrogenase-like predicted oxidoreductase